MLSQAVRRDQETMATDRYNGTRGAGGGRTVKGDHMIEAIVHFTIHYLKCRAGSRPSIRSTRAFARGLPLQLVVKGFDPGPAA